MDKEHSTVDEDSLGPSGRAALDSAADDVGAGRPLPLPGDPTTAAGQPPHDIEHAVPGEQRETAETGAEAEEEEASAGGEVKSIQDARVEVHPADEAPLPPQYLDRDSSGGDPQKAKALGGTNNDGGGSTTTARRSSDARVEVCSGDEAPLPPSYLDDGSVDATAMETKKSAASQQQGPRGTPPPAIARADRRKARYARPITPPRASAGSSLRSVPEQSTSQTQQVLLAPFAEFYAVEARRVDDSSESDGLGAGGHEYSERSVIEAIFVPNPTWWQRHQRAMFILAGIVLTLVVGAVIAIGIILGRPPDSEDPTPTPPTIAPTSPTTTPSPPTIPPPPPIEGISHVQYLGSFFETDCGDRCWPYVEVSGDTVVVAPLLVKPRTGIPLGNVTWERQIHILNKSIDGTFEAVQHIDVEYQPGMISIFDDVMAVGANWETLQSGAVYIYERNSTGVWNQVQRIVAPDGRDDAEFGFQVGIYQDVLAVGAYQDREGKIGSVYIYREEDDGWALERKLAPIDDKILNYGVAVAIHGNRIAVGDRAYGGSGNEKYDGPIKKGAVWLYEYDWSTKNWTELGDCMVSEHCENWWGVSLAFTHDGLLIGCPRDDENAGSVYFYEPSHERFTFRQRIVAMDRGPYLLGSTDQISVHGNSMVVGTDTKSENGTAHIFLRTNNVWVEAAKIEPPAEDSLRFSSRVAISGNNIVVSSWHNAHFYELVEGPSAMACISSKSHGALFDVDCELCDPCVALEGDTAVVSKNKESLQILSGEGFGGMALFGGVDLNFRGVAISGDVVVAGSPDANGKNGTVSVYHKTSTGLWFKWTQLSPVTFGRREHFGTAVDVDGDVIVVGAHSYLDDRGSAYIFRRDSQWSPWVQEAQLLPDDPNLKGFGQAVSVVDTTVAVGDRVYKHSTGAVFVFDYDAPSNSWVQLNEAITNDDCDGLFGSSVALTTGNGLLIGCPGEQGGTGAVYFYTRAATSERYTLQQKISAFDGAPNDDFGGADQISVDRDLMVVGTDKEANGTARVFAKTNGTWVEVHAIESPLESRRFGYKVALSGRRLLVSSIYNVYYYTLDKC